MSSGNSLLEISKPILWKDKKNITNLSSAEFAQRLTKVNIFCMLDCVPRANTVRVLNN